MAAQRCSSLSLSLGESLVATASAATAWLLVEQPGVWGAKALSESALDREIGGRLEQRAKVLGIKALLVKHHRREATTGRRCLAAWSAPGSSWLEELQLESPERLLDLDLEALAQGESLGGRRIETPVHLVCTNGKRDACCASLGRPVAAAVTALRPDATFECSHLGGHRFAANVVCLPHGLWYGRVGPEDADRLVASAEKREIVLDRFRGRSSLPAAAQAADWFLRERDGYLGIEAFTSCTTASENDGGVEVGLSGPEGAWRVRVRRDEAAESRPVSCDGEKVERPSVWSLVAIEPAA